MEREPSQLYRFGTFVLNPAERSLFKDNDSVPLTPKAFDLLVVLAENSGHLLTKNELMSRLWPDAFVEEANLTQNISTLRKALGESHNIETVPKLGYRFNATVTRVPYIQERVVIEEHTKSRLVIETSDDVQSSARGLSRSAVLVLKKPKVLAVVGLSLLTVLVGSFGLRSYLKEDRTQQSLSTVLIDSWKNENAEANDSGSFSHSGKRIAYSKRKEASENIWVRQIVAEEPIRITRGAWNDWTPIWSPDDEQIAFISDRNGRMAIWLAPSMGGAASPLVEFDRAEHGGFPPYLRLWSEDGERIYYELRANLYVANVGLRTKTPITRFESSVYRIFSVSRDEEHFAYIGGKDDQYDIWVAPITGGGDPIQVTNDRAVESSLIWHPDGARIIYSGKQDGANHQLFEGYVDGSPPRQLTAGSGDQFVRDVSRDGTALCCTTTDEQSGLWALTIADRTETEIQTGAGMVLWPSVAPDGKLAFQSTVSRENLFDSSVLLATSLSNADYTRVARNGFAARWSPDGSRVAFLRTRNRQTDVWSVTTFGDDERQITQGGVTAGGFNLLPCDRLEAADFSWSPDGKYFAYTSRKSGEENIWMIAEDGSEGPLSSNTDPRVEFRCPLFSPVGNRIACTSIRMESANNPRQSHCVAVIENGYSQTVHCSESALRLLGWSQTGRSLIVAAVEDSVDYPPGPADVDILEIRLDQGNEISKIGRLESAYFASVKLSPDGRAIAFVSGGAGRNIIALVAITDRALSTLAGPPEPRTYFAGLAWSPDGQLIFYTMQSIRSRLCVLEGLK